MAVPGQEWDYEPLWRNRLISAEHTVMTASQCSQVLGFAAITAPTLPDDARADLFELVGLYVDPQAWNRGIGSRLYEAFEAKRLATDSATAVLEVWSENDRAIRFLHFSGLAPRRSRTTRTRRNNVRSDALVSNLSPWNRQATAVEHQGTGGADGDIRVEPRAASSRFVTNTRPTTKRISGSWMTKRKPSARSAQ